MAKPSRPGLIDTGGRRDRVEFFSGKTLVPFIAALIALSALFGLVIMPRLGPGSRYLNKPAPDFELPVVANGAGAGARVRLSQLRDKVVILDFWASWCGPCAQQAPILDRIARKYGDVVVLGINIGEAPATAARYAKMKGLSYPILLDVEGTAQEAYDANALPTVVMIDKKGTIGSFNQGVVRQSEIERTLRELRGG